MESYGKFLHKNLTITELDNSQLAELNTLFNNNFTRSNFNVQSSVPVNNAFVDFQANIFSQAAFNPVVKYLGNRGAIDLPAGVQQISPNLGPSVSELTNWGSTPLSSTPPGIPNTLPGVPLPLPANPGIPIGLPGPAQASPGIPIGLGLGGTIGISAGLGQALPPLPALPELPVLPMVAPPRSMAVASMLSQMNPTFGMRSF